MLGRVAMRGEQCCIGGSGAGLRARSGLWPRTGLLATGCEMHILSASSLSAGTCPRSASRVVSCSFSSPMHAVFTASLLSRAWISIDVWSASSWMQPLSNFATSIRSRSWIVCSSSRCLVSRVRCSDAMLCRISCRDAACAPTSPLKPANSFSTLLCSSTSSLSDDMSFSTLLCSSTSSLSDAMACCRAARAPRSPRSDASSWSLTACALSSVHMGVSSFSADSWKDFALARTSSPRAVSS
mmetsp:Transcript_44571/g.115323  ORF Transcript_44571/g.115323 Transcript_44571/m.115323 type:complete len:241 (+) Transcript_44571:272-994(+)